MKEAKNVQCKQRELPGYDEMRARISKGLEAINYELEVLADHLAPIMRPAIEMGVPAEEKADVPRCDMEEWVEHLEDHLIGLCARIQTINKRVFL